MSANDPNNRKRITLKPKSCPNPLFEKWLMEWRDEAATRNSELKYCFDKALQSLRKYPIRLKNGKECLILKHFGVQLCEKLDKKLLEYNKNAENDVKMDDQNMNQKTMLNVPKKANKRKKEKVVTQISDESAASSPKKSKPYVPGWRSGPYAILITLYKEKMKPDYCGFMKKAEIQEKAQDLCDSSFVKPDPGSHYTAWSSMSTIVKKGLVKRQGNPAKFSLTPEGEEIARKLYNDLNNVASTSSTKSLSPEDAKIPHFPPKNHYAIYLSDDELDFPPIPSAFDACANNASPVKKKSKVSPQKQYPSGISDSEPESDSEMKTVEIKKTPTKKIKFADPSSISDSEPETNLDVKITNIKKTLPRQIKSPRKKVYPIAVSDSEEDSPNNNQAVGPSSDIECIDLTDDNIEENYSSACLKTNQNCNSWLNDFNKNENTDSWKEQPESLCSTASNPCSASDQFEQYIFLPGEFDVILLVDKQETTGKFRHALSDDPVKELTKLGAKFEVRHLKVGDFLWIGRHKDGKELVLPYIVERKRMDDLGGSIKDGRFHEQKFRLRQCGLQNIIYLVEKYGNETRLGLPINTLHQAAVNTQVIDNFQLKYTNNFSHSMMYLTVMSNLLTDMFKDKTLISCAKNSLPKFDIKDDIVSLITFQEFTKISVKNKILKVQEMFIKQLLQLKGLSVDKALAITQRYPTPRCLIAAFKESLKPELLLANIQSGPLNRNIGPAISKAIYQLYCTKNFN